MNIDWENAPEGATHSAKKGGFYKVVNTVTYYFERSEYWMESLNTQEWSDENLIPRPTGPQWQNGSPPVGEVCEYKHKNLKDWEVCRIKYPGKNLTVICPVDEYEFEIAFDNELSGLEFRPLKTQAEKDTEAAFDLVKDAVDMYQACEILVNAGYKKQLE